MREKAIAVREKLAEYGYGDKPIFVTEAGTHSNANTVRPSSQEQQARYVVELFTQSLSADVDAMIWWLLYDGNEDFQTGLITPGANPVPKKSFTAYQVITEELGSAHYKRKLTDAETGHEEMEAYLFVDYQNQRDTYVAWLNPVMTTATGTLRLTAPQATVRDIYGATTINDSADGAHDGRVTIRIGGEPVYIEVSH